MSRELTQEYLKEILHYDPETGIWTWKIKPSISVNIGDLVGCPDKDGYLRVKFKGKTYKLHKLSWFYMKGELPKNYIDHINRINNDNRWINLREATHSQNNCNRSKHKRNTSGYKGVSYNKFAKKYVAMIQFNKHQIYLGCRDTPEEAFELYKAASLKYHGEFSNIN